MKKALVIGSINIDIYQELVNMPELGETINSKRAQTFIGGKGYNQAVAGYRFGSNVDFIGKIGNDEYKSYITAYNYDIGFDQAKFLIDSGRTGTANVYLVNNDNFIILNSGANAALTIEEILANVNIEAYSCVLLQNELSNQTTLEIAKYCASLGIDVIYNPAPVTGEVELEIMEFSKYVIVNESEYNQIFENPSNTEQFYEKLIITKGSEGIYWQTSGQWKFIESIKNINVIDTTGAGDTFCGVLTSQLVNGVELEEAITVANVAASLAIEKESAQAGMPSNFEVERRINEISNN